jgi:hypothetical protein
MRKTTLGFLLIAFLAVSILSISAFAEDQQQPIGPDTLTSPGSSRHISAAVQPREAYAGNVTELVVDSIIISRGWQGYFGNVTGTITLDDASNNTMYDWVLANPEGEIYASISQVSNWDAVACATPYNISYIENDTYAFNTYANGSLKADQDVDGIDETFNNTFMGDFYVGSTRIQESSNCKAAYLYVNSAPDVAAKTFTETLLYDQTSQNLIFTSILQQYSAAGFDGANHDFQLMVAENGHNGNEATTTYYFYVEIQ